MDADLTPVRQWAEDMIDQYTLANKPVPQFLLSIVAEQFPKTEGYPCTADGIKACIADSVQSS